MTRSAWARTVRPTRSPSSNLAMLRATPNMLVFPARPMRWETARGLGDRASADIGARGPLALSRQNLPTVRTEHKTKEPHRAGALIVWPRPRASARVFSVDGHSARRFRPIALAARDLLQAEGIGTRVVSMPCWEIFEEQDEAYRRRVLPAGPVRSGRGGRGSASAGTAGSMASGAKREKSGFVWGGGGCTASAPRPRKATFTRILASPPRPWPKR